MTLLVQGSFKSTGVAVNIPIPASADYFVTYNQTQAALTATPGVGIKFEWFGNPSMASNSAYETFKTNASNATNYNLIQSGGFNYIPDYPAPEAPVTGSAITNATPAVVTMTNTYNEGDRVVLYNTTGMAQIGGMAFSISSVSGSGFTLLGLPAGGFATAATNVVARRISPFNQMLPEFMYITAISQAAQAVVTTSTINTNVLYVGQKLVFQIPQSFGMTQLDTNNLPGTQDLPVVVTSIINAYTFTINVNTTAFTPFAFPLSTASPTAPLFATVAPAGSSTQYNPLLQTYTGYNINLQPFRSSQEFPLMNLQAGAQSPAGQTNDVIVWQAWKAPVTQYQSNA
jgi:hypothetical protein